MLRLENILVVLVPLVMFISFVVLNYFLSTHVPYVVAEFENLDNVQMSQIELLIEVQSILVTAVALLCGAASYIYRQKKIKHFSVKMAIYIVFSLFVTVAYMAVVSLQGIAIMLNENYFDIYSPYIRIPFWIQAVCICISILLIGLIVHKKDLK